MYNFEHQYGYKVENLPDQPGVYIMKDNKGRIIYIGKAVSLKNRVRQYFRSTGHTVKVGAMVANVADFEYILTDSEVEALILESNLIKNIVLNTIFYLKMTNTIHLLK